MAYVPPQTLGAYDPMEGMGKFSLKKVVKKAGKVVSKVSKVVTIPVRAAASSAISIVSPKVAHALTPEISKRDFEHIGKVGDVVAIAAGAVIAAPVIAAGASAVAGAVASGVSSVAGLVTGGGSIAKTLGAKVLSTLMSGKKAPQYAELSAEEQQGISQADYAALVAQQEAAANAQSIQAAQIPAVPVTTDTPQVTTPVIATTQATVAPTVTAPAPIVAQPTSMTPQGVYAAQPSASVTEEGEEEATATPTTKRSKKSTGESTEAGNPFLTYSEDQLAAELKAVDSAISYRQSKGLSAEGSYQDMTLVQLYAKRALIMAAYTPILMKKYGLYAAIVGGAGLAWYLSKKRK